MTPRKKDDDVQKVSIEDVGQKAKEAHEKAINASVFTERVILAVIGAFVGLTTLGQIYFQYRTTELARTAAIKVEEVAEKAETVKQTLDTTTKVTDEKLDKLTKTTDETKHLVNSGSLVTLKLLAEVSRWKATQTGDADHIKAAELAEKNVAEHEAKQKALDDAANKIK